MISRGKVSLLEAIECEGSLSVAARSIGMSYRRAWDLLADLNRSFKERFAPGTKTRSEAVRRQGVNMRVRG